MRPTKVCYHRRNLIKKRNNIMIQADQIIVMIPEQAISHSIVNSSDKPVSKTSSIPIQTYKSKIIRKRSGEPTVAKKIVLFLI